MQHMLRLCCKKNILKIVIRSLMKKRLKIVFPKIHRFFAASPDRQQTIFTHKKCTKMLYTIRLILQAIFNEGYGSEIFIYFGFKMRYTDFQSSVKTCFL
jgi:hypothetical protein